MAENKGKDHDPTKRRFTDYVVYVVSVCSIEVSTETADQAKDWAIKEVMNKLKSVDNDVYVPKVAVMEAGDSNDITDDVMKGQVPWLQTEDVLEDGGMEIVVNKRMKSGGNA